MGPDHESFSSQEFGTHNNSSERGTSVVELSTSGAGCQVGMSWARQFLLIADNKFLCGCGPNDRQSRQEQRMVLRAWCKGGSLQLHLLICLMRNGCKEWGIGEGLLIGGQPGRAGWSRYERWNLVDMVTKFRCSYGEGREIWGLAECQLVTAAWVFII